MIKVLDEERKNSLILGCFKKVHVSKRLFHLAEIRVIQSKNFNSTTHLKYTSDFILICKHLFTPNIKGARLFFFVRLTKYLSAYISGTAGPILL